MQLALSAGSLHTRPLEEVADLAVEAGFDGMEVIIGPRFTVTQAQSQALLERLQSVLPILSLHAPFFEVDGWGGKVNQLQRTVDLARSVGVPLVTFHPPSWLALEWAFRRWLNRFQDVQRELGLGEVLVTIENMPPGGPGYMLSRPTALLSYLDKKNLFLTFDTAHMGATTDDLLGEFHRFFQADRIRSVHFSDYHQGREHLLPGRGHLPLSLFLQAVREAGYEGALVLELMPEELPRERKALLRKLRELARWMRDS